MCTTVALETALRACIRKQEGVNCAAIAVDASFFQEDVVPCGAEPLNTMIIRSILSDRVLIQQLADGPNELAASCEQQMGWQEYAQSVLYPSSEGRTVWMAYTETGDEADCESDCQYANIGLEELFLRSLVVGPGFPGIAVRVVYVGEVQAIDCSEHIPTETLLKMCAFHRGDGTVAWRIQTEA